MAYDNNSGGGFGGGERVMHQAGDSDGCTGGWLCSQCQKPIEKLPFKPDPARLNQLKCRDCHQKSRDQYGGGGGGRRF